MMTMVATHFVVWNALPKKIRMIRDIGECDLAVNVAKKTRVRLSWVRVFVENARIYAANVRRKMRMVNGVVPSVYEKSVYGKSVNEQFVYERV